MSLWSPALAGVFFTTGATWEDLDKLFETLKDNAFKVLHSTCQQIGKTAVATGLEKVSFHSNPKERQCQKNAQTTTELHSSHTLVK